jgi:hypothetical protein
LLSSASSPPPPTASIVLTTDHDPIAKLAPDFSRTHFFAFAKSIAIANIKQIFSRKRSPDPPRP